MVDPQSWVRFSDDAEFHSEITENSFNTFATFEFYKFHGCGCECMACDQIVGVADPILPIKDFWYSGLEDAEKLNDDFYLLCSPLVRGYALDERRWGTNVTRGSSHSQQSLIIIVTLHIDQVSAPKIDPDPFSNLVLEDEIKDTIEALVCNYAQRDSTTGSWSKDFVRDKGEGRIFLLHGSPGVGKTYA
jgi:hypothetical protein